MDVILLQTKVQQFVSVYSLLLSGFYILWHNTCYNLNNKISDKTESRLSVGAVQLVSVSMPKKNCLSIFLFFFPDLIILSLLP